MYTIYQLMYTFYVLMYELSCIVYIFYQYPKPLKHTNHNIKNIDYKIIMYTSYYITFGMPYDCSYLHFIHMEAYDGQGQVAME